MSPKELCFKLISAESEPEVDEIIKNYEILSDERNWVPYGNHENNVGTFLSQQSHPVAALAEKIVNSIDAVLALECKKRGIDPEGAKAPRTMQEAVELFFEIRDGDYQETAAKQRREIAKNIIVIAEGDKKRPNIIVVDKGEGQNPKDFENTFLSLHKRNKIKIPFVQGKFNMGSTGALPFCGRNHYQLIVSRKHPNFLNASQRDFWGFTLIRYREGRGYEKSGQFEYCTDRGDILKFEGESIPILPGKDIMDFGTYIKMFEYRLNKPSNILRDLYKDLNRSLFNPAIPVLIQEERKEYFDTSHGNSTPLLGNKWRIRIDDREQVEKILSIDSELGDFGMCNIEVVVLKEDAPKDNYTTPNEVVFFTINGQTHASIGRSFLRSGSKANLDYLADSLVIFIELSNIPSFVKDHAFMGSRDRMRDDEIKKNVESDLAEVLKKHEGLKKLNMLRREKAISKNPKDEGFIKKVLQNLVKSNNTLAEILGFGKEIPYHRIGKEIEENFEGKRFPTYLKIHKFSNDKKYCKNIPINSYAMLKLETDAENEYLTREHDKGEFIIDPQGIRKSSYLYNGIIPMKIIPLKEWEIGKIYPCKITMTRPYDEPLIVDFEIQVDPYCKPETNPTPPPTPKKILALNLPEPILVYKDSKEIENCKTWDDVLPTAWTESDIADVKTHLNENNDKIYDVYINMDSRDLHSFLARKKLSDKEQDNIKRLYQTSILLYSIMLYNDLSKKNGGAEDLLPLLMQSISKICLDLSYTENLIKSFEED